ncbi:hypothetical protein HWI79_57 [Cryptosporidium felis]|nr:hypothetical protein HWI79_57 [Cryptosporidium felis]
MQLFAALLLLIILSHTAFEVTGYSADGSVVNGPQNNNNLKVNNQVRANIEAGNARIQAQSKMGKMNGDFSARTETSQKGEVMQGLPDGQSYNSLRSSEIIYNGTQVLTLIFFISVIIFGVFILVIALVPKYARRFGLRSGGDEEVIEEDSRGFNVSEVEKKGFPGKDRKENNLQNSLTLGIGKGRNYSLRRHSLVSDGNSEHCKIATRPRSSSSLPFVQAFTETLDESTTGDESSSRVGKNSSCKNLKKRSTNYEYLGRVGRGGEQPKLSNGGLSSLQANREDEESGISPTSASAVVAIQMSELIARWNPKKDSRLIQKLNPTPAGRTFNPS